MDLLKSIYLSSTIFSILCNVVLTQKNHIKAKLEAKRHLVYRKNLNYRTKMHLSLMDKECRLDQIDSFWRSLLPIENVLYTISSIADNEGSYEITKNLYCKIIRDANKIEDNVRKMNVDFLKSIKSELQNIPSIIEDNLDNEDYRLSDKEVKKVLRINGLSYNYKMLEYEKENDIKY